MTEKEIMRLLEGEGVLRSEQEKEIFMYYKEHPSLELRNALILKNMGLIHKFASYYESTSIPREDLEQEAIFGLVKAIEYFDPELGNKFSTYASIWIRQSIGRYIDQRARIIRVPINLIMKFNSIRKAVEVYEMEHNEKSINYAYVSDQTGMSPDEISSVLKQMEVSSVFSINRKVTANNSSEGVETEFGDFIPSEEDIEEDTKRAIDGNLLVARVKILLSPREWEIVSLRFGVGTNDPLTLEQVGNQMGITRERVRQIEKRALQKLSHDKKIQLMHA